MCTYMQLRAETAVKCSPKLGQPQLEFSGVGDADHPTSMALADMGVRYLPGVGRGSKSFLLNAA